jgi:HKD family nuclease
MRFLSNTSEKNNHLTTLTENLKWSSEVYFAVAFIKVSGITSLLNAIRKFLSAGGKATIIAGQNFGLTEPRALHYLRELFESYPSSLLYLAKANAANSIFHPKLYFIPDRKV